MIDFPKIHCPNCGELLLYENFNWNNGGIDDGVIEDAMAEIKCGHCNKLYQTWYDEWTDENEAIEDLKKSIEQ